VKSVRAIRAAAIAALLAGALLGVLPAPPSNARANIERVATGLDFPTNMAFAADGRIFFNEKDTGNIRIIQNGDLLPLPFATLPVIPGDETGLLGLALDPHFPDEPWVYVYYSDSTDRRNRLVRIPADGDAGGAPQTLLDALPSVSGYHNGGDLAFGPDGKLYLVTGEAHEDQRAQDPNDLGGKVLRLDADGSIPPDNPFGPGNPVFALGIRNSFGLCFNPTTGDLWETENGPDRDDEVNRIVAGANYGWPDQLGPGGEPKFVDPVVIFPNVIVPTGCAFFGREVDPKLPPETYRAGANLYFGDYSGGNLHRTTLAPPDYRKAEGDEIVATFDAGITDVAVGTDGALYVATSDSILRVGAPAASATPASTAPSASPSAIGTIDRPATGPIGPGVKGGAGLAVLALLVGAWLYLRSRLDRADR
jgi:quinoprotein glucose dehydrogenase